MQRISVVANNMANVNTNGYKTKNSTFSDLVYTALEGAEGGTIKKGHGIRMEKTESLTRQQGGLSQTGRDYDFAISGSGYFALLNPNTDEVLYTRDGRFEAVNQDGEFYLCDSLGRQVLDKNEEPILLMTDTGDGENSGEDDEKTQLADRIGIFKIPIQDGLEAAGLNAFTVTDKSGYIYSQTDVSEEEPIGEIIQGSLELSNVELARELANLIESQKAYQLALKMVQTSDEIEQLECELRR